MNPTGYALLFVHVSLSSLGRCLHHRLTSSLSASLSLHKCIYIYIYIYLFIYAVAATILAISKISKNLIPTAEPSKN